MLDLCMFAEGSRHSEELAAIGDKAKVECLLPQNIVTHGNRETWEVTQDEIHVPEEILNAGYHSGATYHQNLAFLSAIKGEAEVPVTALDGHRAVAMGVAAQMAAAEKRRVDMMGSAYEFPEQGENLVNAAPRKLGGKEVGPLAFGCWRLVGDDVADATQRIETALDNGLTLIDNADVYGLDWGGQAFGERDFTRQSAGSR